MTKTWRPISVVRLPLCSFLLARHLIFGLLLDLDVIWTRLQVVIQLGKRQSSPFKQPVNFFNFIITYAPGGLRHLSPIGYYIRGPKYLLSLTNLPKTYEVSVKSSQQSFVSDLPAAMKIAIADYTFHSDCKRSIHGPVPNTLDMELSRYLGMTFGYETSFNKDVVVKICADFEIPNPYCFPRPPFQDIHSAICEICLCAGAPLANRSRDEKE